MGEAGTENEAWNMSIVCIWGWREWYLFDTSTTSQGDFYGIRDLYYGQKLLRRSRYNDWTVSEWDDNQED